MGIFVDTHQKFYNRLNAALAEEGLLEGVQSIRVGYDRDQLSDGDFPLILMTEIIEDENSARVANGSNYQSVPCSMTIFIYNLLSTADDNHLYNAAAETGPMYLKEKVLDALFTPDASYDGYVVNLTTTSGESEIQKGILITPIKLNFILSKPYPINSRRTSAS